MTRRCVQRGLAIGIHRQYLLPGVNQLPSFVTPGQVRWNKMNRPSLKQEIVTALPNASVTEALSVFELIVQHEKTVENEKKELEKKVLELTKDLENDKLE